MLEKLRHVIPAWTNRAEARHEQISALRRQSLLFLTLVFINAIIACAAARPVVPPNSLLTWCVGLSLAGLLWIAARRQLSRDRAQPSAAGRVLAWIALSASVLGGVWGLGVAALYVQSASHSVHVILIALAVTTTSVGAITFSTSPRAMIAFVLPSATPIFIAVALAGQVGPLQSTAVGAVFLLTVLVAAWIAFRTFAENVNARSELSEKNLVIELLLKDFEDTSSDWLWETDGDLCFTKLSEPGVGGMRVSIDSVVGKTPEEMSEKDPAKDKRWAAHLEDLKAHHPFHDYVYESRHEDGTITWISVSGKPRFDRDGNFLGYRGVMSNISAQVEADQARRRAEEKLRQSYADLERRVQDRTRELRENEKSLRIAKEAAEAASLAKDSFIANISHELRTPLNAIIGFSEIMSTEQMGALGNPDYQEFSGHIFDSGHHLLEIVNDVLDLSKSVSGSLRIDAQKMELDPVLRQCLDIMAEQYSQKGVELRVRQNAGLPAIEADPVRLRQIILNLLSNAMKFTAAAGVVQLSVAAHNDGGVAIRIEDSGIGMDEQQLRTAMEPFGQIDNSLTRTNHGTGLGLPLTKQLVELHGGAFHIESAPGRGTVVEIRLPGASDDDVAAPATDHKAARTAR